LGFCHRRQTPDPMGAHGRKQGTQFSDHAYVRVGERLSLEPSELADQLDYGFAINIREEAEKDIAHRLFYSADDLQCFVAIQNINTRVVVTILPVDYYEQRNPRIPPSLMEEAKRLVSWTPATDEPHPLEHLPGSAAGNNVAEVRFHVRVVVSKGSEWTQRIITLKPWPSLRYDCDVQRLIADEEFQAAVVRRSRRVMIPSEKLVKLKVRLGNKAAWSSFPFDSGKFVLPSTTRDETTRNRG